MACWADLFGWVRPQFPDANSDDVARLAVQAMHLIVTKLGGIRQWETKRCTSDMLSVAIPEGFRITEVYNVTVDKKCLALNRGCRPCSRTASWDASGSTVQLYNVNLSLAPETVIEYGIQLAAGDIGCDIDEVLFNKFAPVIAEFCLSRLQATVTTNRSMHRISQDYYANFGMMVNDLKREQSRASEARTFQFGGKLW